MSDTTPVVSELDLRMAFMGTDFGGADPRKLIEVGVLKKAAGYHCGYTLTRIMVRLQLINEKGTLKQRGRELLRAAYSDLMLEGG